jgi:fermentation-respiration switch protein FrsA (DUF1100 family)
MEHVILGIAVSVVLMGPLETLRWSSLAFVGVLVLMLVKQNELLYQPQPGGLPRSVKQNPKGMRSPAEHGLEFEDVADLVAEDGVKLSAWLIKAARDSRQRPTLVYMHGNAGNIGHRIELFRDLRNQLHVNVMALDWRGFGDSEGEPSELGLLLDARAALGWLVSSSLVDKDKIFLFGTSLGGAVGIALASASDKNIRGMVCENSFTSVSDVATSAFPFLRPFRALLVPPLLRNEFPSLASVPRLRTPLLVLAGRNDTLVPCAHSLELHKAAASRLKRICVLKGGHNDLALAAGAEYYRCVRAFLDEVLRQPAEQHAEGGGG